MAWHGMCVFVKPCLPVKMPALYVDTTMEHFFFFHGSYNGLASQLFSRFYFLGSLVCGHPEVKQKV